MLQSMDFFVNFMSLYLSCLLIYLKITSASCVFKIEQSDAVVTDLRNVDICFNLRKPLI